MLIRFFSLISILVILFSPQITEQVSPNGLDTAKFSIIFTYSHSDTSYKIIPSTTNTYGYEVLINGKVFITPRKNDAGKAAQLVLKKMNAGIMPPAIDKYELDSMKVKF